MSTVITIIIILAVLYFLGKFANKLSSSSNNTNKTDLIVRYEDIPERPLPQISVQTFLPDNESQDRLNYDIDSTEGLSLKNLAFIEYKDASGNLSKRKITINHIYPAPDLNDFYIEAFCHERRAPRTFLSSRIQSMVDMETGEMLNVNEYFNNRFNNSPLAKVSRCFHELEPEILILVFMGRSDGRLMKKERQIICQFIKENYKEELDDSILDEEIKATYCSQNDFRNSVKIIKEKDLSHKNRIFEYLSLVSYADKIIDPMEAAIIEIIKKDFNISAS